MLDYYIEVFDCLDFIKGVIDCCLLLKRSWIAWFLQKWFTFRLVIITSVMECLSVIEKIVNKFRYYILGAVIIKRIVDCLVFIIWVLDYLVVIKSFVDWFVVIKLLVDWFVAIKWVMSCFITAERAHGEKNKTKNSWNTLTYKFGFCRWCRRSSTWRRTLPCCGKPSWTRRSQWRWLRLDWTREPGELTWNFATIQSWNRKFFFLLTSCLASLLTYMFCDFLFSHLYIYLLT